MSIAEIFSLNLWNSLYTLKPVVITALERVHKMWLLHAITGDLEKGCFFSVVCSIEYGIIVIMITNDTLHYTALWNFYKDSYFYNS